MEHQSGKNKVQQQTDGLGGRKDQIAVRGGVSVVVNVGILFFSFFISFLQSKLALVYNFTSFD